MSRFRARHHEDRAEINLSPMLDVVFIMLIFFIVTASFIKEVGLPVSLPPGFLIPPKPVESIVVIVESDGTFVVNGRVMSANNVRPYVRALHGEYPEAGFAVLLTDRSRVKGTALAVDAGRSIGHDVITIMQKDW